MVYRGTTARMEVGRGTCTQATDRDLVQIAYGMVVGGRVPIRQKGSSPC